MFDPIIDLLNSQTPLVPPWGRVAVIVGLFGLAWLIARSSAFLARHVLAWHDRRHSESDLEATGKMANIKRQETLVGVIRTGIAYTAFGAAAVLSIGQLTGGVDRLTAIAGASFAVIVAGFELQGVVEDVSLRRTRLRALNGEVIQVHNSQITAVRVLPRGVKELAIELFVTKRDAGEKLVNDVAEILPEGPTTFARRPEIDRVDELAHNLTRIRVHATVAPGREWLAESFFTDLLRQRAADGLIVHGPVALAVDERATWSYARASAASRTRFRRSPLPERAAVRGI